MFNERFKRECELAGLVVDSFVGRTFVGNAAILKDDDELARAIRSTTVPVNFEPLLLGGWLLHAKQ